MHIPRPCKRERKGERKNLVAAKPPRITIHAPLYWKHHHVIVLVTQRSSVFGRAGESTLHWNTTAFLMCWRVFFKRLQYIYIYIYIYTQIRYNNAHTSVMNPRKSRRKHIWISFAENTGYCYSVIPSMTLLTFYSESQVPETFKRASKLRYFSYTKWRNLFKPCQNCKKHIISATATVRKSQNPLFWKYSCNYSSWAFI
jgi:hypothetical protein